MDALRQELYEYYGALNEVKRKIRNDIPEKPEALVYYEQTMTMGLPIASGGVLDQPYIFIQEYAVCDQVKRLFDSLESANDANQTRQG